MGNGSFISDLRFCTKLLGKCITKRERKRETSVHRMIKGER